MKKCLSLFAGARLTPALALPILLFLCVPCFSQGTLNFVNILGSTSGSQNPLNPSILIPASSLNIGSNSGTLTLTPGSNVTINGATSPVIASNAANITIAATGGGSGGQTNVSFSYSFSTFDLVGGTNLLFTGTNALVNGAAFMQAGSFGQVTSQQVLGAYSTTIVIPNNYTLSGVNLLQSSILASNSLCFTVGTNDLFQGLVISNTATIGYIFNGGNPALAGCNIYGYNDIIHNFASGLNNLWQNTVFGTGSASADITHPAQSVSLVCQSCIFNITSTTMGGIRCQGGNYLFQNDTFNCLTNALGGIQFVAATTGQFVLCTWPGNNNTNLNITSPSFAILDCTGQPAPGTIDGTGSFTNICQGSGGGGVSSNYFPNGLTVGPLANHISTAVNANYQNSGFGITTASLFISNDVWWALDGGVGTEVYPLFQVSASSTNIHATQTAFINQNFTNLFGYTVEYRASVSILAGGVSSVGICIFSNITAHTRVELTQPWPFAIGTASGTSTLSPLPANANDICVILDQSSGLATVSVVNVDADTK